MRASRVVRVALPLPLPGGYDYRLPASFEPGDTALTGRRIRVPFRTGELIGVVIGAGAAEAVPEALREASGVLDDGPLLEGELWRSLVWAAGYYHHPLGEVLAAALPATLRRGEPLPSLAEPGWAITAAGRDVLASGRVRAGPGQAVLGRLRDGPLPVTLLRGELGPPAQPAASRLARRGWIEACTLDWLPPVHAPAAGPALNEDQQRAVDAVATQGFEAVLLEGVTGSGKTEVYLRLIERALSQGRQALVLVPEIALTPQALSRYRARLGAPVLALHSGLGDAERARAWAFARSGRACVLIGTRSAVFSPLPAGGVIIVDEEHDASYKQADGFRYHARDLALVRARALQVPIVLGSATPSLESLARVGAGRMSHVLLPERAVASARRPSLRLVDLRGRRLVGGLDPLALDALAGTLAAGRQALVFRNRRGWAPVLACASCGWHCECARCDRPMTLHRRLGVVLCHHCGARRSAPPSCPECGHAPLDTRGLGTERIEEELRGHFPDTRILRIDRDSTRGMRELDAALDDVARGEPAILVGTQLLAKGHDWPALTLVVIADADGGLYSPDFRARERLAQVLTQVAGRAGRGADPGTVLVQTRQPAHAFWSQWFAGGYPAIAAGELDERRAAALPPFRHQALLAAEARTMDALDAFFGAVLPAPPASDPAVDRLGPLPAPMPRRAGHHRMQVLLECDARAPLHALLSAWLPVIHASKAARRVRWSLDVDPLDLY